MTEVAVPDEIMLPHSGELVAFNDAAGCASALHNVRTLKRDLDDAIRALTEALVHHSSIAGSKTLRYEGVTATVKGGSETVYDAEQIEQGLRMAGMPEERIREIVKETVSYSVNTAEAKRAAAANPAYARVVDRHSRVVEKSSYVSVSAVRQ